MAHAGLALHPDAADLLVGAAFAAMRSGRCHHAILHLRTLRAANPGPVQRRRAELVRAACQGPWRWQALIGASVGYRASLVDRQREVDIRMQRGSQLHGLCLRLRSLCDPDRPLRAAGRRDSGIDLWLNLTVRHLYRAGGTWDFDIDTTLFQRRPRRTGYGGDGAILRVAATYRHDVARQVHLGAETGLSRFQQGRADLALSQRHRRIDVGLTLAHGAGLRSHIGATHLTMRSRWRDLARTRVTYGLEKTVRPGLTISPGVAHEWSRRKGGGLVPGLRAREAGLGVTWSARHIVIHLRHARRHDAFRDRLSFLAAPHRARTRTTRLELRPAYLSRRLNLKVAISFEYRKISSPDPFRPPSSKILLLRVSREIFAG